MRPDIIDAPCNTARFLDELYKLGVKTVIRYYNMTNSSVLPEKCLTRSEADTLGKEGFSLAVVFQQGGRDISEYTPENGKRYAARALSLAQDTIGQPSGSAIYFSVDHDFYRADEHARLVAFFTEVKRAFAQEAEHNRASYKVGVYGSGSVCTLLKARGLADYFWLPRALGWSGSREFYAAGGWHLFQNGIDQRYGKLDYDTNIMNPAVKNFGSFRPSAAAPRTQVTETTLHAQPASETSLRPAPDPERQRALLENSRYIAARNGLFLRGGPGADFAPLETLPYGKEVIILGERDGWALVDLEGDGKADGFCHTSFLQRYGA